MLIHTTELSHPHFTEPPEILNAVDVVEANSKFIFTMLDPIMLFISKIHQSIIGLEAVGVNNRTGVSFAPNNRQQLTHRAVFDDLGINFITTFKHPKDRYFTLYSVPSFATNMPCSEVTFVEFDLTVGERTFGFTKRGDPFAESGVKSVNSLTLNSRKCGCLFGLNIFAEKTNYLASFALKNVHNFYIPVFHCPITTYKDNTFLKLS